MTSAERAKDLVDAIFLSGSQWGEHDWKYAQEIIAEALRRAQNDKLEEAARAAEQAHLGMSCFVDAANCGQFNSGVRHAAKAVRSLIEKD